ncbi:sugar ABC transporter permease [Sulfolobus acidocaldarius SUSAZ]|nr:sugar ABC transporter permease [Sulfolobus acidocaldarius SUSAZ]
MNILNVVRRFEFQLFLVNIIIALFFYFENSAYFSSNNITTIFQYLAEIGIIAIGEAMLMLCGEIDLSPPALANFVPLITLTIYNSIYQAISPTPAIVVSILLSLGLASLIGLMNGLITTKAKVNSLITTVGTLFLFNGIALIYSGGYPESFPYFRFLGGTVSILPVPFIWSLGALVFLILLLHYTKIGVWTIAAGSNPTGASEVGVPVDRVKIINFIIMANIGALVGIIQGSRVLTIGATNFTADVVLEGIAAAVIGGTSLVGGKGSLVGAFLGSVFISELLNGFNILGINAYEFDAILGGAIVVVMVLSYYARRASYKLKSITTATSSSPESKDRITKILKFKIQKIYRRVEENE